MTRELKLALIVGFSLVLVVVVLVSDHLSQARKAKLASAPTDNPAAIVSAGAPAATNMPTAAPSATISSVQPGPLGSFTGSALTEPPAGGLASSIPVTEPTTGGSTGLVGGVPPAIQGDPLASATPSAQPQPTVVTLRQGRSDGSTTTEPSLLDEVRARGGDIVDGKIYLPPAANVQAMPIGATSLTSAPLGSPVTNALPEVVRPAIDTIMPPAANDSAAGSSTRTYVVVKGDTAIKIARKLYGDGNAWRKLAEANPGTIGRNGEVRLGARLKVPADARNFDSGSNAAPATRTPSRGVPEVKVAGKPAPKVDRPSKIAVKEPQTAKRSGRTYTVRKGDTLGVIAQRTLGSSRRVQDILEANASIIDDADSIPAGTVLNIPAQQS